MANIHTVLIFFILTILFSCQGQQSQPSDVTVELKGYAFTPAILTVKEGQTITWVNAEEAVHNVLAANKAFSSPDLYQEQFFTWTATKKGAYEYACGYHSTMKGKVIVE